MWAIHLVYFSTYASVGALGPLLKDDLGLTNTQFGILCGAVGIGTTSAQLPGGMWCDRIGVRNVLTVSFVGIGLMAAVFSLTGSLAFGCFVLFLLGLAVGCSQIAGTKAIVDWFPSDGRATAMGIKQTGVNVGGTLASLILPVAAGLYGWRFLYKGMGLFVCVAAALFALVYRDARRSIKKVDTIEGLLRNRVARTQESPLSSYYHHRGLPYRSSVLLFIVSRPLPEPAPAHAVAPRRLDSGRFFCSRRSRQGRMGIRRRLSVSRAGKCPSSSSACSVFSFVLPWPS